MGRLLDKINAQRVADLRICGKQATAGLPESATAAESCGFQKQIKGNPQSPQSLRTLKPAPDIDFHKSANPQGVLVNSEKAHPDNIRNKLPVLPEQQLIQLAIAEANIQGLALTEEEVASLIPPSDWRDAEKCTPEELQAWATALALRAIRYRGQVPAGWDQLANCKNCGPVYSFAGGDCLACPWCEMKRAGKAVQIHRAAQA